MKQIFSLCFTLAMCSDVMGQNNRMTSELIAEINNLKVVADSLYELEQDKKAIPYYEKALSLTKSDSLIMAIKNTLGNCYASQKQYDLALTTYQEALAISQHFTQVNPKFAAINVAKTWSNIAMLHRKQKNYDKAIEGYKKSIEILEKLVIEGAIEEEIHIAKNQTFLAMCYGEGNEIEKSQEAFFKALDIWQQRLLKGEKQYLKNYNSTLNNLGILQGFYLKENNFLKIIELETKRAKCKEALMDILDGGRYTTASHYGLLAFFQVAAKQYSVAEQTARYGFSIDSSVTKLKSVIAHALLFQNKDDEAKKIYEELKTQKDISNKPYSVVLLTELGGFKELGLDEQQIIKARKWIQ
jgi:tetratricopeptide (TPR) repeat protein